MKNKYLQLPLISDLPSAASPHPHPLIPIPHLASPMVGFRAMMISFLVYFF
jgi:hypothetical protein